jgi:hypothetical protein
VTNPDDGPAVTRDNYSRFRRRAEALASQIEDESVMAGGTSWQLLSVRAVEAANDLCMYLGRIVEEIGRST